MTAAASPPLDTLQRRELAEGVEVEVRPAGPMVRAAAWLIDAVWMALFFVILAFGLGFLMGVLGTYMTAGIMWVLFFVSFWGYQVFFEAGRRAATPGKRAMKLRVVAESGGPAPLGSIMLRNLARAADGMPGIMLPLPLTQVLQLPIPCYFAGLLVCLFTRRFQRMGDLIARTLVVYVSPGAPSSGTIPPPLSGLQTRPPRVALTREERSAVVRFDERASLWSPARREELAGHAAGLTQVNGARGVEELALTAAWLRDS